MASDEAKVKISADISSFNSAISSAKSTITELNSALRLVQTQMNTNGTSTDQLQQKLNTLKEKSSALKTEEDALKQKLQETVSVYGEDSQEAEKLRTQLNNVQTQEERCEQEIDKTNQAIEEQQKAEEQANSASGKLVTTINEQEKELEELKTQYTNVVLEEGKDSEAAQELAGKITTLNSDLQDNKQKLADAEQAADDLTKEEEELGDESEEAGNKMSEGFQAAYDAIVAAGLVEACKKLVEAMKSCVEAAAGFESQMSTVQALSGATTQEMNQLSAAAKEMGATTAFTATEAGEALEYMALAGWNTDEMLDGLSGVINLAAAAGEDLGTTTDIVTDALTAFGLGASDSAHFADVLAAASTNSNTTVSQMGEAFKQTATTAGTLGYSIDDVSVALGLMANNGLKGSTAGSALSTALTRMSGANSTATAEMDKLNVSMFNADGSTKDLSVFLGELRDSLNENCSSSEDMQVALYNLAGQRGMKGLAAIVNTSDEDFAALTESIDECEGSAEEMAGIKLDNFQGSVTLLKSAWDALMTTMGSSALGTLTNIVDGFTNIVTAVNEFLSSHEFLTKAIDALCVGLIAGAAALGVAAVACSELTDKIRQLTAAMMENQIGLIITAITAAAAALTAFIVLCQNTETEQNQLRQATKDLSKEVKEQKEAYDELCDENEETAQSYVGLVDQLESYLAVANKEESDRTAVLGIIDQLNEAIPGLGLAYDEETDSLNMSTDAIREHVEAANEETEYNALIERQSELLAQQSEAEALLSEAQEGRSEVVGELNEGEELSAQEMAQAAIAANQAALGTGGYTAAIENAQTALDEVNSELDEVNAALDEYGRTTEETASSATGQIQIMAEDLAESLIEIQAAYDETRESAEESFEGQFDLWEQAGEVAITSADEILAGLQSQQQYWEEYSANLENLNNRNIEGIGDFVAAVDDGSEDGAAAVASLAAATDTELEEIMAQWSATTTSEKNAASDYADVTTQYTNATDQMVQDVCAQIQNLDNSDEARQAAYDTLAGYMSGLDEESGEVSDETVQVAQELLDKFAEELGVASPSWKTEEYGLDTMLGYENGVTGESGNVDSTMSSTAQSAIQAFQKESNSNTLVGSGKDTMSGYMSGNNNQKGSVLNTMSSIATSAITTWKGEANNSTLQGSGSDTMTGYQTGANSQNSATSNKLKTIAQSAINAFKAISTVSALNPSGSNAIQGAISGANSKSSTFSNTMGNTARTGVNSFSNNASSGTTYSAGANAVQGAINGANSKGTSFSSTMASIASNAMARFKSTLGVSSPSWIAEEDLEYFGEGAIIGAENSEEELADAMGSLAGTAVGAFQNNLNADGSMQAVVNGDNIISMYDALQSRLNNMAAEIEISASFDYDKLAAAMSKYNMTVSIGEREFGRVVREVI